MKDKINMKDGANTAPEGPAVDPLTGPVVMPVRPRQDVSPGEDRQPASTPRRDH